MCQYGMVVSMEHGLVVYEWLHRVLNMSEYGSICLNNARVSFNMP